MSFNNGAFNRMGFNVPNPALVAHSKAELERFSNLPENFEIPDSAMIYIDAVYVEVKHYLPEVQRPQEGKWSKPMSEKLFDAALSIGSGIIIAAVAAICALIFSK